MADVVFNMRTFQKVDELMRICRFAIRKAQRESHQRGVANVYSINGQLYFETPSGEYCRARPRRQRLWGLMLSRLSSLLGTCGSGSSALTWHVRYDQQQLFDMSFWHQPSSR